MGFARRYSQFSLRRTPSGPASAVRLIEVSVKRELTVQPPATIGIRERGRCSDHPHCQGPLLLRGRVGEDPGNEVVQ